MWPETGFWGNCLLVAALAHLKRKDEAANALQELDQRRPGATIAMLESIYPATASQLREKLFDGLRKAGLPER